MKYKLGCTTYITQKKMSPLSFVMIFSLFLLPQEHVNAQVVLGRLIDGGHRSEIINIYSNKKEMDKASKKKFAGNDHEVFYLVTPRILKNIEKYIRSNCKPSPDFSGNGNEDIYMLTTGSQVKSICKLREELGKDFLVDFKKWMQKSSFSRECSKLNVLIQRNLIDNFDEI